MLSMLNFLVVRDEIEKYQLNNHLTHYFNITSFKTCILAATLSK